MWGRRLLFLCVIMVAMLSCFREEILPVDGTASISQDVKYIALTFDDGPRLGTTDRLLDGLKERGASATFFLVGEEIEKYPELVKRMQAEGHQIGNHTWSHARLEQADEAMLAQEVGATERLLDKILGGGDYWLRPPYGLISSEIESLIEVPMVKWSVDPRDWESRDEEKVTAAILEAVTPNSIILLHDIYPTSVDAALNVVDRLEKEGYLFVTVAELLRLNGVQPQDGVLYRTGTG